MQLTYAVIIDLLKATGPEYLKTISALDLYSEALFSVAWAGEESSMNWFHIAREYTENFIHQQQMRDVFDDSTLLSKELFYPFIRTFMQALPFTYKDVNATEGDVVQINISTEIGGNWFIKKENNKWVFTEDHFEQPTAKIIIDPATSWKLFSKGISPEEALRRVTMEGNLNLAKAALRMVSVMA